MIEKRGQKSMTKLVLVRNFVLSITAVAMTISSMTMLAGCGQPEAQVVIPTERINTAVAALEGQDYTLAITESGTTTTYLMNKTMVKASTNTSEVYYEIGEETYSYTLTVDVYVKDTATFAVDSVIYAELKAANWTDYDKESDTISGTMDGMQVTLNIAVDGDITIAGTDYRAEITNIGATTLELPDSQNVVDTTTSDEIPLEFINGMLASLANKNYMFFETIGESQTYYYIKDDDVRTLTTGEEKFQSTVDGKSYEYVINTEDSKWHKREIQNPIDADSLIYNKLNNAEWIAYDDEFEILTGVVDGKILTIQKVLNDYLISGSNYEASIGNIGIVNFSLPSGIILVDETIPPVLNELYTRVNGKIQYDMAVVSEVVTKWIKGDNDYNQDLLATKSFATDISLDRVLFINVVPDRKMEMGVFFNSGSHHCYTIWEIDDTDLIRRLSSGYYITKDALLTGLKESSIRRFNNTGINKNLEYTTLDADYETTNKEEFDKLTTSVLTKLNVKGVQQSYKDTDGVVEDLTDIEIIVGFRTQSKGMGSGYELGQYEEWNQYYIAKVDGAYQLLNFKIDSSSTYRPDVIGNVANGTAGWIIGALEKKDLDIDTISLYLTVDPDGTMTT